MAQIDYLNILSNPREFKKDCRDLSKPISFYLQKYQIDKAYYYKLLKELNIKREKRNNRGKSKDYTLFDFTLMYRICERAEGLTRAK